MEKMMAPFLYSVLLLFSPAPSAEDQAEIVDQTVVFEGEFEDSSGYPWWNHVKYPLEVRLVWRNDNEASIWYRDNHGNICSDLMGFHDKDIGGVVFKSCLPLKNPESYPPIFILYISDTTNEAKLEVRTYKKLFVVK